MSCFDLTHVPVAKTARAAAIGPVSMSTRPDLEGSDTVEIATRTLRGHRLRQRKNQKSPSNPGIKCISNGSVPGTRAQQKTPREKKELRKNILLYHGWSTIGNRYSSAKNGGDRCSEVVDRQVQQINEASCDRRIATTRYAVLAIIY